MGSGRVFHAKAADGVSIYYSVAGLVGGIAWGLGGVVNERSSGAIGVAIAALTALAAFLHWRRFQVPITVAALTAAIASGVASLLMLFWNRWNWKIPKILLAIVLIAGLCVFVSPCGGFAGPRPANGKSDVAFWLHLLAAPMIAHPLFAFMGATDGQDMGVRSIIAILVVYLLFTLVALAVDRRALLVSVLAYVSSFALFSLFRTFGGIGRSRWQLPRLS
ncbi:MAG: hypothetical protein U5N53_10120 [Mycobacterium sp.]|nr:hypothetical protein [Mycobacterium sp.]